MLFEIKEEHSLIFEVKNTTNGATLQAIISHSKLLGLIQESAFEQLDGESCSCSFDETCNHCECGGIGEEFTFNKMGIE